VYYLYDFDMTAVTSGKQFGRGDFSPASVYFFFGYFVV
jgi:hypothetical protein